MKCLVNIQHDCVTHKCVQLQKKTILQEREASSAVSNAMLHNDDYDFILNTATLHNYKPIRAILPASLQVSSIVVPNFEEVLQNAVMKLPKPKPKQAKGKGKGKGKGKARETAVETTSDAAVPEQGSTSGQVAQNEHAPGTIPSHLLTQSLQNEGPSNSGGAKKRSRKARKSDFSDIVEDVARPKKKRPGA